MSEDREVNRSKFRVYEPIGSGGMADVFRASLLGAGFSMPVALKRLRLTGDERRAARLIGEARVASRLQHPNIVSVYDFDRDEHGNVLLAMELVEGMDLGALARTGLLPLPLVLHIAAEVLQGLAYIHELRETDGTPLGLVHRDVSARNVLVSWDGAIKISDFGLAMNRAAMNMTMTDVLSTVWYLSPEQIQGLPLDGRADLFAVGVILYELLTGERPFVGDTPAEVLAAKLAGRFRPPCALRPELPAELEEITMRLLQCDREQRFKSARAAMAALYRCEAASPASRLDLAAFMNAYFPAHARVPGGPGGAGRTHSMGTALVLAPDSPLQSPPQSPPGSHAPAAQGPRQESKLGRRPAAAQTAAYTEPVPSVASSRGDRMLLLISLLVLLVSALLLYEAYRQRSSSQDSSSPTGFSVGFSLGVSGVPGEPRAGYERASARTSEGDSERGTAAWIHARQSCESALSRHRSRGPDGAVTARR